MTLSTLTSSTMKRSSLFILLGLFILFHPVNMYGQTSGILVPDCVVFVNATLNGNTGTTTQIPAAGFDNRTTACQSWTFQYQTVTTSGTFTSIAVQSAIGEQTPGAYGNNWTVATGINPNTNLTNAVSTFTTGCVASTPCTVPNSWARILITRNNFVGSINGILYGYKTGNSGGGGGGGGGSGCTAPCPVVGTAAAGSVPSGDPVQVAGQDGTNIRTLLTDTVGALIPSSTANAGADGVSNTQQVAVGGGQPLFYRVLPDVFNGTTNDRQFTCPLQAAFNISAGTDVVMVAGVSSTNIKICHVDFSSDTVATFTIRQGTGTTCLTNTAAITGAYPTVATFSMDYQPTAVLHTTTAARDVCLHVGTAATVGGTILYAQF